MERRLAEFRAARPARPPPRAEERAAPPPPPAEGAAARDRPAAPPPPPRWAAHPLLSATLLRFLLWLALLGLFAELRFGLPFFVLSLFYWMHVGTRAGPAQQRRPGEPSAYSVFNPGCQPIRGTLTAQQLERELRGGSAAEA